MALLPTADPEVAAAVFKSHLDRFWASGRPLRLGMELTSLDPLHSVVGLLGQLPGRPADRYFVKLGAEHYDAFPPMVAFVKPCEGGIWVEASDKTRWFPSIKFPQNPPAWFGLHPSYHFEGERDPRQLVCFSFTAEYYMSKHSPKDTERWVQGRHTLAATLNRLHEVLSAPYYQGPSGE